MRRRFESTSGAPVAVAFTGLAQRAAMAVNTLWVVAVRAIATRCHASDGFQDAELALGQFARMVMEAILVGAFAQQKVEVAELQLLQAIQLFAGDGLVINPIYALPVFISLHDLENWRGGIRRFGAYDLEFTRIRIMCRD